MSIFLFLIFCFCSSCRVGPSYYPPEVVTPDNWKAQTVESVSMPCVNNWWEVFKDELLNALEQEAFENNPSLEEALQRVAEARATVGVSWSGLFPQIDINPVYTSTGTLFKLYGVPTGVVPGIKPLIRIHQLFYSLTATMNYELDLWGKNRSLYDSAVFNFEAQWENYNASLLSLTADLASFYFNLRALDTQIDLLQNTIKLRQESLKLTKGRYGSGIANAVDVSLAELELSNTEAQYYDAVRQRILFENAIATLIGKPASCFSIEHQPLHDEPPPIPAGVPSTILCQRPDIAAAERTMASEHAQINVAYAAFFPAISLTGSLGYVSPEFKHFMKWKSRYWQYGANAAQYAFDAGRRCSEVDIAWARFRQAEASYQQVVLRAFEEVENALNDLDLEAKQYESIAQSVKAAGTTLTLSTKRYKNGIIDYYNVIDSQRSDLNAKSNLVNLLGLRYQATIQLIKALGGAWSSQTIAEEVGGDCESKQSDDSEGPS